MAGPIPVPNLNLNQSSSAKAEGSAGGSQQKWGDFVVGGQKSSLSVPWYAWAAAALVAVVWLKRSGK